MLIIKNIDYIEVKDSTFRIATDNPSDHFHCIENGEPGFMSKMNVAGELINGFEIDGPYGRKIVIGVTSKVGEILGMSYGKMKNYEDKIKQYEEARFFTRLKWLFTGTL